jgi:hypothetical protein
MICLAFDKMSQDAEYYKAQLKYFLFHDKPYGLSQERARRSANEAASSLARAANRLHWHENHCSICRRVGKGGSTQHELN